jgi:hypothetical protein
MDILDVCIMYYFDRCLIFMGMVTHMTYPHGYGMGINSYLPIVMGDPTWLFFTMGM